MRPILRRSRPTRSFPTPSIFPVEHDVCRSRILCRSMVAAAIVGVATSVTSDTNTPTAASNYMVMYICFPSNPSPLSPLSLTRHRPHPMFERVTSCLCQRRVLVFQLSLLTRSKCTSLPPNLHIPEHPFKYDYNFFQKLTFFSFPRLSFLHAVYMICIAWLLCGDVLNVDCDPAWWAV